MIDYYTFERLMLHQQKEIEQKARHAWKWMTVKEEKIKDPAWNALQLNSNCCPACC
ncbi:hypothetical protein J41TS12_22440 [Paenibacillus antibioticophila]|uniref:Uncharacterized protein n=2 Tax=Paenibacillus TaxID=44249 RepID=A0A919Y4R6_9BACL|nr:hypothetical protein J41TS12_22440 [Paenibacillus antibioticophila]GIO43754.1 hypothetical protein J41TS4_35120 [Paenibacillus apis]